MPASVKKAKKPTVKTAKKPTTVKKAKKPTTVKKAKKPTTVKKAKKPTVKKAKKPTVKKAKKPVSTRKKTKKTQPTVAVSSAVMDTRRMPAAERRAIDNLFKSFANKGKLVKKVKRGNMIMEVYR